MFIFTYLVSNRRLLRRGTLALAMGHGLTIGKRPQYAQIPSIRHEVLCGVLTEHTPSPRLVGGAACEGIEKGISGADSGLLSLHRLTCPRVLLPSSAGNANSTRSANSCVAQRYAS